jgi:hypothetical protein
VCESNQKLCWYFDCVFAWSVAAWEKEEESKCERKVGLWALGFCECLKLIFLVWKLSIYKYIYVTVCVFPCFCLSNYYLTSKYRSTTFTKKCSFVIYSTVSIFFTYYSIFISFFKTGIENGLNQSCFPFQQFFLKLIFHLKSFVRWNFKPFILLIVEFRKQDWLKPVLTMHLRTIFETDFY